LTGESYSGGALGDLALTNLYNSTRGNELRRHGWSVPFPTWIPLSSQ
jgi:hypothetical protein